VQLLGTESQNETITEVGTDFRGSFGPTPMLKWNHLKLVAQDHVQAAFQYLQGGRYRKKVFKFK